MESPHTPRHAGAKRTPPGVRWLHLAVTALRERVRDVRPLGGWTDRDHTSASRVSTRMRRRMLTAGALMTAAALVTPLGANALTVHRGNTLSVIARQHHTTVRCLALANHIRNVNLIYVSQHLRVTGCGRHISRRHSRGVRVRHPSRSFDRAGSCNARAYAHRLAGSQYWAVDKVFTFESGWNPRANNPSSGAYGIPQSLPGSKMASAGWDWRTNACTQVRWGIDYMRRVYGSPAGAWAHEVSHHWY